MTPDTEAALRAVLEPGERLLWSGRPRRGLMLRGSDAFLIPFSLFWCGFAIFWEWTAVSRNGPFFDFFGVPFVLIGLDIAVGRFIADAYRRSPTFSGVSDQRIVILSAMQRRRISSLMLAQLGEIDLVEGRNGTGTITFGRDPIGAGRGYGVRGWRHSPVFRGHSRRRRCA